jgi:predicted ATPase
MGLCASVLGRHGTGEEGLELLDISLAQCQANQVHWWDAELHRITGVLLLAQGTRSADDGEASLLKALEIARQQEARSLELRTVASLAGLWRDRGKVSEARDLLQPIVGWFPADQSFAELAAAKRMLTELAAR